MSVLLQRARETGRIPPSFLKEENMKNDDGFENEMLAVMAGSSGFTLSTDPSVSSAFTSILKKASGVDTMPGANEMHKKMILELRRVLLLTLVTGTDKSNPSLDSVLQTTYLSDVKTWLDDILSGAVGGIDMLLHLLKNIADLPVTTSMVKNSGLGKLVGSIEKHRICSGPNEANIRQKVDLVKSSWKASVKARKMAEGSSQPKLSVETPKRAASSSAPASPTAKRSKVSESSPKSSLSSLLNKMSGSNSSSAPSSSANSKAKSSSLNGVKVETAKATWKANNLVSSSTPVKKKVKSSVKWADHFGGSLSDSRLIEGENIVQEHGSESWSDRKKRDREKEKKLLLTMKKAKLLDEDVVVETEPVPAGMKPTVAWKTPALLPESPDAAKPQLNSMEVSAQNERMKTVVATQYFSENSVPSSPAPLSQIEQALDMTAQSSANVAKLPFFAAQQPEAAPEPVLNSIQHEYAAPAMDPATSFGAPPEFVQALGLPLFLVGQDTQALQTLASSPSLLNSLVDSTGTYDQARLLGLVQTLSGKPPTAAPPVAPPVPSYLPPVPPPIASNTYGSSVGHNSYGVASSTYGVPRAPPGMRKSDEGNLHVSGFGPMTTQADLIALFSPYVVVDEVVMKGSFAFVNTSDPVNAQNAKVALTGTLVGGQPLRINQAQRKGKDSGPARTSLSSFGGAASSSSYGPSGGTGAAKPQGFPFGAQGGGPPNHAPPPPPAFQAPTSSVDDVRDSRGNAPTKNLFVAGYGPNTTEAQIRQIFGQHTQVVGVVLRGNYTFVNTVSREEAVKSRQMLQGQMVNGGPLRINFAKETGRLGTSFDLTYNQQSGPNARRTSPPGPVPPPQVGYYGR